MRADYNGNQLVIVVVTFLILTYISVSLRVYVRLRITASGFAIDDYFMLVSQVVFTFSCICILLGVDVGLGHHNADLSTSNEISGLMYQAFATMAYVANMMFIKLSIAFFLLRIAVKRGYVWVLRSSIVIITIWSVTIFIFEIFQCMPIQAQWDITIKDSHCVSGDAFAAAAYSISVMTIVTDWLFALLPIPMIWSVRMSTQAKATVTFILSLGIFASIATLIRLRYIVDLTSDTDVLYTGTSAMVWTLVEPGVAIIAASLITIRPLMRAMNFSGFDTTTEGCHTRGNRNNYTFNPSQLRDIPSAHLSLRSDIPSGNWNTSSVSSQSADMKRSASRMTIDRITGKGAGGSTTSVQERGHASNDSSERSSDEFVLLQGQFTRLGAREGITRTVHVRVQSDRASKVGTG